MQHSMSISYETVKYGRGKVGAEVRGFGDSAVYDTSPSPLRAGSTTSLFGRGGILDSGNSILDDLASGNILGAIRTGGSLRNTLKGTNVSSLIASELVSGAISTGLNYISNNKSNNSSGFSIPSLSSGISAITTGVTSSLFSGNIFGSSNTSTLPGVTNTFGGVSSSTNQLAEKFAPGTLNTSDFSSMFATMKASIAPGMAVLETQMSSVASASTTDVLPSVSALQDAIPSADSLASANTVLTNASNSFAPVAQSISQQMDTLVNSGEMQQLSSNLKNTAGDVFSNGSNISQ